MIDNDYREVDTDEKDEAVSEKNETTETPVETGEVVTDDHAEEHEKSDDFDEFCAMCRRPVCKYVCPAVWQSAESKEEKNEREKERRAGFRYP